MPTAAASSCAGSIVADLYVDAANVNIGSIPAFIRILPFEHHNRFSWYLVLTYVDSRKR